MSRSMFDAYMAQRRSGCSPRAATEIVARDYGRATPEEIEELERILRGIERRRSGELTAPSGPGGVYIAARRAGQSHIEAVGEVMHVFSRRSRAQAEDMVQRAMREWEQEQQALADSRPGANSDSKEIAA